MKKRVAKRKGEVRKPARSKARKPASSPKRKAARSNLRRDARKKAPSSRGGSRQAKRGASRRPSKKAPTKRGKIVGKRRAGGRSKTPKHKGRSPVSISHGMPSKERYRSGFRRFLEKHPKKGRRRTIAIVRMGWNVAGYKRNYILPVQLGYMTAAQAKRVTLEQIDRMARLRGMREGFEVKEVMGVAALKPREKRRGIQAFEKGRGSRLAKRLTPALKSKRKKKA